MQLFGFRHIFEYLNQKLAKAADEQKLDSVHYLTKDFHVWPDLHGNRSPLADSTIKGLISAFIKITLNTMRPKANLLIFILRSCHHLGFICF